MAHETRCPYDSFDQQSRILQPQGHTPFGLIGNFPSLVPSDSLEYGT